VGGVVVTEPSGEDYPPQQRMTTAIALARLEAKLDVAISQQSMNRSETSRRLAEHDAILGRIGQTLSEIQQEQAAARAKATAEADARPPRQGIPSWVSLGISVLLALYVVLDHTPGT
jgi:hypothetical protein